jgi:hypothetical protein
LNIDAPFPKRAKACQRERLDQSDAPRRPGIDAGQSLRFLALRWCKGRFDDNSHEFKRRDSEGAAQPVAGAIVTAERLFPGTQLRCCEHDYLGGVPSASLGSLIFVLALNHSQ